MELTYDVRIWKTEKYVGARATTYRVRWVVAGKRWRANFRTAAAAESFRSQLVSEQRKGIAFDAITGRPQTLLRLEAVTVTWFDFACQYVDMKWPTISPKHRKGIAEALTTVTLALSTQRLDHDRAKETRSALLNWAFNHRRGSREQPARVTDLLQATARASRPLSDLARPDVVRAVLDAGATKVDGGRASGRTASWKRSILSTALNHAVERGLLEANPVPASSWRAPKSVQRVDRRCVANPAQARALLATVSTMQRSGPLLVGFFAVMYYAALRPEEAAHLRESNLELPEGDGWGWLHLDGAAPEVDKQWTDTATRRHDRELKHRAAGDVRRVPCPPALVAILREHLATRGTDDAGRLFRGERGGPLAGVTYTRLWDRTRRATLTSEQYVSPLARRPYDLRHAAVSTWLNGGVAPSQVAEWAGHSVEVLLRVYAKCLDGGEALALQRIDQALQ